MPRRATTRRGQGEGNVRQRKDGRWEGRYVAGYQPNGAPIRRSIYATTQAEAVKLLREVLRDLERDEYLEPDTITVGDWLNKWMAIYIVPTLRPNTVSCYKNTIMLHIIPRIGALKLQKLRVENVQVLLNDMVQAGLAVSTAQKAKAVLHGALAQAVTNRLVIRNAAEGVTLPKLEQEEINPLTVDEQKRFVEALPDTASARALAFVLRTGLRVGELIGLKWSDLEGDSFTVRRTIRRTPVIYTDGKNINPDGEKRVSTSIQIGKPKTAKGQRKVPLGDKAHLILDEQRRHQLEERVKAGGLWTNDDLIFTTATGKPLEVRNISRTLYKVLGVIGAEKRGVHALRHTFATRWIESGGDVKSLSEILGHADVATTLRLYVHASVDVKMKGMKALDDSF